MLLREDKNVEKLVTIQTHLTVDERPVILSVNMCDCTGCFGNCMGACDGAADLLKSSW